MKATEQTITLAGDAKQLVATAQHALYQLMAPGNPNIILLRAQAALELAKMLPAALEQIIQEVTPPVNEGIPPEMVGKE